MKKIRTVILASACLAAACAARAEFNHSHALYGKVLSERVRDERVDYEGLKASPGDLDAYLRETESVTETDFDGWPRERQLAFLYNVYNARTLRLIIDHYPGIKSIKDIGNVLRGPWDQPVVKLFGRTITLGHLEHKIIRPRFGEPRGHFALVCAAKGCPPLRGEPYVAARLNAQLEDQARAFLSSPQKNYVDAPGRTLYISPIFDWFQDDFLSRGGSVVNFVKPYFPPEAARRIEGDFKLRYTVYDWSLNDRKNP